MIIGDIAEALAENVLCIGDYEERILVNALYDLADIGYLSALYNAQEHLLILMRIRTLALEDCHAAMQPVGYIAHKLVAFFAYDIADVGVINAVEHKIDDLGDHKHRNDRVHCAFDLVEDDRKRDYYDGVGQQNKRSEVYIRKLQAHKFCDYIGSARRCAGIVDYAEAESLYLSLIHI